jgi:crotonobetainyl-CoA:carnitine CoA-transferase CaiB-like acyl-CoA transferase
VQSLKGVKVVEFAAFAAGPVVGKHLGDHGATVVHIESKVRPDGFRAHYPPYKDNIHGLNRSGLFALCNNDKLDITLNLKKSPKATGRTWSSKILVPARWGGSAWATRI